MTGKQNKYFMHFSVLSNVPLILHLIMHDNYFFIGLSIIVFRLEKSPNILLLCLQQSRTEQGDAEVVWI